MRRYGCGTWPPAEPLTGHTGWVRAVATGVVDGRPVVFMGSDEAVQVWDLATGLPTERELVFPAEVNMVAACPDGRLVGFGQEVALLTKFLHGTSLENPPRKCTPRPLHNSHVHALSDARSATREHVGTTRAVDQTVYHPRVLLQLHDEGRVRGQAGGRSRVRWTRTRSAGVPP